MQSAGPAAAVGPWKGSQAQIWPTDPGQPRRPPWDGPQTSRQRSLITPLVGLQRTVHRRFSFWPGTPQGPARAPRTRSAYESPGTSELTAVSDRAQWSRAGRSALGKIALSLHQVMPQTNAEIASGWAWSLPCLPFQKGEQKAWGQPAVGRGSNDINQNA